MDGEASEDISKAIIQFQLRFCIRVENFYADKGSILLRSNLVSPLPPTPGDLANDVNIFNNKSWSHFRQFSESLTSVLKRIAKKFADSKIPKLEDIMLKYEVLTSVMNNTPYIVADNINLLCPADVVYPMRKASMVDAVLELGKTSAMLSVRKLYSWTLNLKAFIASELSQVMIAKGLWLPREFGGKRARPLKPNDLCLLYPTFQVVRAVESNGSDWLVATPDGKKQAVTTNRLSHFLSHDQSLESPQSKNTNMSANVTDQTPKLFNSFISLQVSNASSEELVKLAQTIAEGLSGDFKVMKQFSHHVTIGMTTLLDVKDAVDVHSKVRLAVKSIRTLLPCAGLGFIAAIGDLSIFEEGDRMSLVASISDKLPTLYSVFDEIASSLGSRLENNYSVWRPHISLIHGIEASDANKAAINSFLGLEKRGFSFSSKVHFRRLEFRMTTKGEKELVTETAPEATWIKHFPTKDGRLIDEFSL